MKRDDHNLFVRNSFRFKQIAQCGDDPFIIFFYFHKKIAPGTKQAEGIAKSRNPFSTKGFHFIADIHTLDFRKNRVFNPDIFIASSSGHGIVNADENSVGGQMNVRFHAVGIAFHCQLE